MSGSSGTSSSSKTPKFVRQAGKQLGSMAGQAVGNYDPQFFTDNQYAAQQPGSISGLQGMQDFSSQPSQDYYSSVLGGDYLGLNPQMQQAVMQPAMQSVNNQFNAAGRYGSSANQQQSQFAGMQALMPYYDAERQRQQQAAQMLPQAQANDYQTQLQGGQGQEAYNQQPIDQAMAQLQFENQQPLMQAQAYQNLVSPLFGVPNQTQQNQGWMDSAGGLLSGGGSAATGAAAMFKASDRRLKRNIKKLGKTRGGFNLYEWTYIWGEYAIGVMADEVKKVIPGAVRNHNGYDMVDYSQVT